MRAAEKEVEQLERKAREEAGLPVEADKGKELPPIKLLSFKEMQKKQRLEKKKQFENEKQQLGQKVEEIELQMKEIQDRLKELSKDIADEFKENRLRNGAISRKRARNLDEANEGGDAAPEPTLDDERGAIGPEGDYVEFPEYDGTEPPKESKKAFTHFCINTRREVKASLDHEDRKNKVCFLTGCVVAR